MGHKKNKKQPDTRHDDALHHAQQVLRARARRFSQHPETVSLEHQQEVMLFRSGTLQFAVPIGMLSEIRLLEHCTPIPQAAPHVAGVTNVRANIVGVYRLTAVFQQSGSEGLEPASSVPADADAPATDSFAEHTPERYVLVGHGKSRHIALLADYIIGTEHVVISKLGTKPVSLNDKKYVVAVDATGRVYLDMEKMTEDTHFYNA